MSETNEAPIITSDPQPQRRKTLGYPNVPLKRSGLSYSELIAIRRNRKLQTRAEIAEQNSTIDELTGLPNRRFFNLELQGRIRERQRTGQDFYVLFMDIDDFKSYNTQYTHAGGDKILKVFKKVNKKTRPREGVIRLAGDEFVQFVDSGITQEELLDVAVRNQDVFRTESELTLAQMIPQPGISPEQAKKNGRISIGLVKYQDGMTDESLIELSSAALLRAKTTASGIAKTENGVDFTELSKAA